MKVRILTLLLILSMLFVTAGTGPPAVTASPNAVAPDLGTAATFVGLAASTFTNTGSGVYYGNVGVSPGTAVEGFPPGEVRNGEIYRGGAVPAQAQIDARAAYTDLAGRPCNTNMTDQDLGGKTLQPGVYCFDTSAYLTGDLVLDALGDPHAIWVFQTGSTLITGPGSTVRLINGGQVLNVFWQVGSAATLDSTTRFKGNIIAEVSITLVTGASLSGRALALTGAVTMDTEGSPPIANPALSIVKQVDPANALPGQLITYTLTFTNFGNELIAGITISDSIPISVTNTSVISSGVAITQVVGARYEWDIAPLAAGQGGVITITGQLSPTLPTGIFTNTAIIASTMVPSDPENDHSSVGVHVAPMMTNTLTVNSVGSGTVMLDPAGGVYTAGTLVTLTAMPDAGWYFSGWSGDLSDAANPETITMDSDKVVTATFEMLTYTLDVNIVGNGAVDVDPLGPYYYGAEITLTAAPTTGWYFGGWTGDLLGGVSPEFLMIDSNKVVTATFTSEPPVFYTLTVAIMGNGTVTPDSDSYLSGTLVTLTATPDAGWQFDGWTGDLSSAANPAQVTMDADKAITATFTQIPSVTYTLTVNIVGHGSVTLEPSGTIILPYSYLFLAGTVVTPTAAPDTNWYFTGWSGDLSGTANPAQLTMDANKVVTATFETNLFLPLVQKNSNP